VNTKNDLTRILEAYHPSVPSTKVRIGWLELYVSGLLNKNQATQVKIWYVILLKFLMKYIVVDQIESFAKIAKNCAHRNSKV